MFSTNELLQRHAAPSVNSLMEKLNVKYTSGKYVAAGKSFQDFDEALNWADDNFTGEIANTSIKAQLENGEYKFRPSEITNLPILTIDYFPGKQIVSICGSARGGTVRAKHIGKDLAAGLKNLVGGEIKGYTELLAEGREEALYSMKQNALEMGADAVIGYRFSSSMIDVGVTEMMAYGTAVKLSDKAME